MVETPKQKTAGSASRRRNSGKGFAARYRAALIALGIFALLLALKPTLAPRAVSSMATQIKTMLFILPPVFILLGLLDAWVPREAMIRLMGPGSEAHGTILAFAMGSAAAGPLYGAFPIASVLMKKGASFFNVLVFLGAWSTTKVPMFLFESQSLGWRFALSRLVIDIVGIMILSALLVRLVPKAEIERVYHEAETRE